MQANIQQEPGQMMELDGDYLTFEEYFDASKAPTDIFYKTLKTVSIPRRPLFLYVISFE